MHLTKLRLAGFKSFPERQEVLIEPGLTGVVGPNGCGKSNVVEALRWVMGETSAKQLRGGEMEDVIFSGTGGAGSARAGSGGARTGGRGNRPARNLAEVVVTLDNQNRTAPAAYNEHDELEIVRVIERGQGSAYKINNRPVRAKDVQLLFADANTGSGSTAIISQGRIGSLIGAKPEERRSLLEEAAGIKGLNSRRHEAELKLNGARTNLSRLHDIMQTVEEQVKTLTSQARRAKAYRTLNERLQATAALMHYLKYRDMTTRVGTHQQKSAEIVATLENLTQKAATLTTQQTEMAAALEPLRQQEIEAAAGIQRLRQALKDLDAEVERRDAQRQDILNSLQQLTTDRTREQDLLQEMAGTIAELEAEVAAAQLSEEGREGEGSAAQQDRLEEMKRQVTGAEARVSTQEQTVTDLTTRLVQTQQARDSLTEQISALMQEITEIEARQAEFSEERKRLTAALAADEGDRQVREELQVLDTTIAQLVIEKEAGAAKLVEHRASADRAHQEMTQARQSLETLQAERDSVTALLSSAEKTDGDQKDAMMHQVTIEPGYEAAVAAVFGEALQAKVASTGSVSEAYHFWQDSVDGEARASAALPSGTTSLADYVTGPTVLARRLQNTGIVESAQAAEALQSKLNPGQCLVTPQGDLWRWDGYCLTHEAPSATGRQLKLRARLDALAADLVIAAQALTVAEESFAQANASFEASAGAEAAVRDRLDAAYQKRDQLQQDQHLSHDRHARDRERLSEVSALVSQLSERLDQVRAQVSEKEEMLSRQQVSETLEAEIETAKLDLAEARSELYQVRSNFDQQRRAQADSERQLAALRERLVNARRRHDDSTRHLKTLATREDDLKARLAEVPEISEEETAERHQALRDQIEEAEEARRKAADTLAEQQNELRVLEQDLKQAERGIQDARELRGRLSADLEHLQGDLARVEAEIIEQHDLTSESDPEDKDSSETQAEEIDPQDLLRALVEKYELDEESADVDQLSEVESKWQRLYHQREHFGPVNLLAEEESATAEEKLASMRAEQEDLEKAIARLSQGISDLNKQGRQQLAKAFEEVNEHFKELFTTLFGGGKATLKMEEPGEGGEMDLLTAGVEIMASPPGKKAQRLSLLSGGEQALTAIALVFAVFLTNPAPLCVLDEVDAPLDDSNVDRFCTLLEDIAAKTGTRFLVVTHHRMTMARMNRLYGVTMPEPGVSQLVSVNLEQAESIREAA